MTTTHTATGPVLDEHTDLRRRAGKLRNTLRLNATTALLGGVIAAIAPGTLDRVLGTGHPGWVRIVGVGLVVFAVDVAVVAAARLSRLLTGTVFVTVADVVWVAGSVATISMRWYSTSGTVVIGLVAAMVCTFAVLQIRTRRTTLAVDPVLRKTADETPPIESARATAGLPVDAARAWAIITDHELYGRLAPNLRSVRATAINGPDMQRTCTSRGGESWTEHCTLWDDGHRFDVTVDAASYPYPLQLVQGSWAVEAVAPGDVRATMDFRYQPRRGLRGAAMSIGMQAVVPLLTRRILRGWRTAAGTSSR